MCTSDRAITCTDVVTLACLNDCALKIDGNMPETGMKGVCNDVVKQKASWFLEGFEKVLLTCIRPYFSVCLVPVFHSITAQH